MDELLDEINNLSQILGGLAGVLDKADEVIALITPVF